MDAFRSECAIKLTNGRVLAYAEFGDAHGFPIFYFHGFPGGRLEASLSHRPALAVGARILSPDRPGVGGSQFVDGRSILSWTADVTALADALAIGRFGVIGVSGGAPYALACAERISHRIAAASVVGGLGPPDPALYRGALSPFHRLIKRLGQDAPQVLRGCIEVLAWVLCRRPQLALKILSRRLSEPDRVVLSAPDVANSLAESLRQSLCGGGRGAAADLLLYTKPWGFEPGRIPIEIQLWHGGLDRIVPPAVADYLAASIPLCRYRLLPEEGHYSLPIGRAAEILEALVAAAKV